jgi:hypothetical protein
MWCDCPKRDAYLLALLAEWNGKPLNAAAFGQRLRVSRTTAMAWVKDLARQGLVRLLPSFDVVRRPLLWLPESLLRSRVEAVMASILEADSGARLFWWKTGRVREIHLLVQIGQKRIGFCFCASRIPQNKEEQRWLGSTDQRQRCASRPAPPLWPSSS